MEKLIISIDVGEVNLAICILDYQGNIYNWSVENIKGSSYAIIGRKLKNVLDNLEMFHWFDEDKDKEYEINVVIERQMSRNPKMRIISGQIHMYYIIKQDTDSRIKNIVYYSPKYKLKVYQQMEGEEIVQPKCKNPYNSRKNLSKQHCRIMLLRGGSDTPQYQFYKESKKKDDLSDSMLQGLAYIKGL